MAVFGLFGRNKTQRAGEALYAGAVEVARDPKFYLPPQAGLGVPDTLDGRFDLIGVHVVLLIRRLHQQGAAGAALAQAVFDAMFKDMDRSLREMGVGDLAVSKRVKEMWEALHGRAAAYTAALEAGDDQALHETLVRNLWRGKSALAGSEGKVTHIIRQRDAALQCQDLLIEAPRWAELELPQ